MEQGSPNSVLRRKASAAREQWQARAMTPAKALRLSLARAADDLWDLALAATGIALAEETAEAMLESLSDDGLICLLDGPEGAVGAMLIDFPLVAGLIEAQTMGRVSPQVPETRRSTRTDAAMIAPLIDDSLGRFDAMLDEVGVAPWSRGYRFGSMMESVRMLSLALKATDFHVFRFSIDLAAKREGEAVLIMPVPEVVVADVPDAQAGANRLEAQVLSAPAELDAVLFRMTVPLSAISQLKPGECLPIPRDALADTALESRTHHRVATSRLGQINGMRAVRLNLPNVMPASSPASGPAAAEEASTQLAPDLPGLDLPGLDLPEPEPEMPPMAAPIPEPAEETTDDLLGDLPSLDDLPGLGDLPDLGDFPAMGASENEEAPELPELGAFPMASLPEID
jgi:flagellar motor switch protein FliM